MLTLFSFVITTIVVVTKVESLDNGLALTPPMGWMTWQRFRCITDCEQYPLECISEKLIKTMAKRMVVDGYLKAGYEYIIVDDCWMSNKRDSENRLQPDPIRFPSGIKSLANYVQSLGLKFGIYEDSGYKTCAGYPGIYGHLEIDAQTFADWEVDYIKLDGCYNDPETLVDGYIRFGELLNQTGRPIVYSCSWPAYEEPLGIKSNYSLLTEKCNLWRNWDDIEDSWYNVTNILDWFSENQDRIAKYSGPGHWNDPDMLLVGNFALSEDQSKAQMAIWSIMAAPLLMSVDLRTIKPEFRQILLNPDAIAINQDKLGIMGKLVYTALKRIDVWVKPIMPIVNGEFSLAIGFISNRIDGYPRIASVPMKTLGLNNPKGYHITNIFDPEYVDVISGGNIVVRVKPSGTVFLKLIPKD
nr:alpha-N-acetylgalactosaminidase-like [Onthophagus taurus]